MSNPVVYTLSRLDFKDIILIIVLLGILSTAIEYAIITYRLRKKKKRKKKCHN